MGWHYLSIPKLQRCNRWSLRMDKSFYLILNWACHNLSMLGVKLIQISKRQPDHPIYIALHLKVVALDIDQTKPWKTLNCIYCCFIFPMIEYLVAQGYRAVGVLKPWLFRFLFIGGVYRLSKRSREHIRSFLFIWKPDINCYILCECWLQVLQQDQLWDLLHNMFM